MALTSPLDVFSLTTEDVQLGEPLLNDTILRLRVCERVGIFAMTGPNIGAQRDAFLKLAEACSAVAAWCDAKDAEPRPVETLDVQLGCPYCNGPASTDAACDKPGCVEIDAEFRKAVGR